MTCHIRSCYTPLAQIDFKLFLDFILGWRRQKWCNIPEALELLERAKPLKVPYLQKACYHGNCSELNSGDPIINGCSYNVQEQKVI